MAVDNVKLSFNPSFQGTMTTPTGNVVLGDQDNGVQPYHLLFGALGSCFYATFLSISLKKRLTFSRAELEISGTKRTEVPPTLEHTKIHLVVFNPSDEEQLIKSAELGAKFCSIHETISKVAKMELVVEFKTE
jgi:putative redox protein